jgi:hypothetical protein
MPRILEKLRIREVSAVDRGAGEGVKVMLMKREFTADQRKEMAGKGEAMADGGYPIANKDDLHNAIRAYGRAKNPEATKQHIITRARALGATEALPDDWKVSKMAKSFSETVKSLLGFGKTASAADEIAKANEALEESIGSILADATMDATAKSAAISKSFDQHAEHLNGTIPEAIEKALSAAGLSADDFKKGTGSMTDEEKKKLADAEKERDDTKKAFELQKREIAMLKMSDKHKAYCDARGSDMGADEKDKFMAMEPADRDAHMAKHPVPQDTEKRIQEEVTKRVANDPTVVEMRKQLDVLTKREAVTVVRKSWATQGLTEAQMDIVEKAWEAVTDKAPIEAMVKQLAAGNAQAREAGIFKELGGSGNDNGATPHDQILAKADELRKVDPKLTREQAYAKAYTDPANHEIAKRDTLARREAIRA